MKNNETPTRGIKNCRDSRLFMGCSPLQLMCNLTGNRPQSATFHTATVVANFEKKPTMWLFKSEIKISENFGAKYIDSLIELIETHFEIELVNKKIVEPELIFIDYKIDKKNISFMSEGMVGTSIIGRRRDVKTIITLLENEYSKFLESGVNQERIIKSYEVIKKVRQNLNYKDVKEIKSILKDAVQIIYSQINVDFKSLFGQELILNDSQIYVDDETYRQSATGLILDLSLSDCNNFKIHVECLIDQAKILIKIKNKNEVSDYKEIVNRIEQVQNAEGLSELKEIKTGYNTLV
ncbi:hypothetical protein [Carboxylicivirga sp. N1Y90]|uniref:hypothetical protein n=1 Tax=Carboxylicivirga fragile TaxID=3417571 RepID=UPI003D345B72|nr:hypothetical protein [Marinilabiliaceae bacterium N1Y90]